ncbi:MAG: heme exporter protein CcmB [Rhodospirillales bacterium]|nr:heme exporter protein CcmB [Rhodospirillales bacterium]
MSPAAVSAICRREFTAYFTSPLAYVFICIFLALAGSLTFFVGGFFVRGEADLQPFFQFHPWLYLLLIPAIGMRLWAEERKSGTLELLMTLPITAADAVVGKFLAAWLFAGIALVLTFPLWITVNVLGSPDNGVIAAAYIGSWLMAGGFLALSACASALTPNQVIAFVLGATLGFLFLMSGVEVVQSIIRGWLPPVFVDAIADFSFLSNFDSLARGVIELRTVVFFLSLIGAGLVINTAIIELKKSA